MIPRLFTTEDRRKMLQRNDAVKKIVVYPKIEKDEEKKEDIKPKVK